MEKTKKKTKLKSKVSTIKKLIAMDPFHPGSLTPQQYTKSNGKKSKKYYTWQSSFQGKKKSVRIPDDQVAEIQKLIDNAKRRSKTEEKKDASILKSYNKALKELMDTNAKIRKANGEDAIKSGSSK
jgi:hypothetical protein